MNETHARSPAPVLPGMNRPEQQLVLLVVLCLFAVNLFFFSGRFHSIDEMALLSTTESIVKWQHADINALAWGQWLLRGPDSQGLFNAAGDLYAKKAPLVAWLAVPPYALAGLVGFGQVQASMLLNALVVALTGGVVFRFARRLGYSAGVAVWAALLFGLGTSALVYAKYLFTEPVAGLGFVLAAEAVWRAHYDPTTDWRVMASGGIGFGAAVLTNPVNLLFTPILFAALLVPSAVSGLRSLVNKALNLLWPLTASLVIMTIWNAARFGNPLTSGYHLGAGEGFTSPLRISLPGMLASPARGLVWFVPAACLALAGLISFFKRHTRLAALSLALIAGHVLVFSAWWMWWSGWGWGPRFLMPITPFIALMALPALEQANLKSQPPKRAGGRLSNLKGRNPLLKFEIWYLIFVILVFVVSAGVQVLGASVGFDEYENIMTQTHLRGDPEGDLYKYGLDMLWSWPHSPLMGHVDLLRKGNTDLAWLPGGRVDWLMLIPLIALAIVTGWALALALRHPGVKIARQFYLYLCALCVSAAILVLWRAESHPLRATYGLDPLEGQAALASVASRAQPGDGVMLIRPLAPGEMDSFPRFPRAYGIPDDSLFGAEWNADLERLVDNARARHRRLWLVAQSEEDSFAAQVAARLKPTMKRTERAAFDKYTVVLFEPR